MKLSKKIIVTTIAAISAQAGVAFADAPAAKWYDTIGLSGYAQTSYVGNLNKPKTAAGVKVNNTGRQFDVDSNGFSFNTFLLQIAKPVSDSDHYGFTVRLRTGQDAKLLPGGSNLTVQEGYLTYMVPGTKLTFIGGKFVTAEGYEVVDSVANPNFSEGILFTNAEPITNTGLKANFAFSDKVNATLGVVNGWDQEPDNNTAKTIIWQVSTTPTKKIGWSFQGYYGKELADPSHSQRLSLDTVLTLAATDMLSFAVQGNWGQESGTPTGTNHWIGAGLWGSLMETSKDTSSLRFEVLRDQNNGARFLTLAPAPAAPVFRSGNSNQTVKEFTVTQKHMLTSNMGVRAEYRHDWSNQAYFVKSDGSAVRNQNTISADWFVTF